MSRFFYAIVVLFFLSSSFHSHAQVIKGAIMGGVNLSQVDGDELYGFKRVGANVGAAAIIPFTDTWSITLETIYSMEGSNQKGVAGIWLYDTDSVNKYNPYNEADSFYINGAYDLHLNYIRIPILVHYNDRNLSLGAGFQYGRLVKVSEQEQDIYNTTNVAEAAYNNNDFSILADIKYRIYRGLFFNFRYSYSLMNIRDRTFHSIIDPSVTLDRKQYNNTMTFRLMWVINDRSGSLERQKKEKPIF